MGVGRPTPEDLSNVTGVASQSPSIWQLYIQGGVLGKGKAEDTPPVAVKVKC